MTKLAINRTTGNTGKTRSSISSVPNILSNTFDQFWNNPLDYEKLFPTSFTTSSYVLNDWFDDVKEEENETIYAVDVPGVSKKDITISYQDGTITVEWTRQKLSEQQTGKRQWVLPDNLDHDKIEANLSAGVLTLSVAVGKPRKKTIKIK